MSQKSNSTWVGFALLSAASFATMAACVRFASMELPQSEVVFFRNFIALLILLPLLLRHGVPEVAAAFCELRLGKSRAINYGACGAPIGTDAIIARQTPAA